MNRFTVSLLIAVTILLLSGCGPEVPPTISAVDVQSTAVAAAFTIVAETQAAIPTATPLPPTETPTQTPLATNTPLALPSVEATFTSAATSSAGGGDPCANRYLSWSPLGKPTKIRIANATKVAVTVSLYLNETPDKGECGYRPYELGARNDVLITDLVQGCYSIWAWSDDPKGKFNSSGYGCINNNDKWTFEISESTIKFLGS